MGNKDTIDPAPIVIFLNGKARIVKLTMRALFVLEENYGTVNKAFGALRSVNINSIAETVSKFLHAMSPGVTKDETRETLSPTLAIGLYGEIAKAVKIGLPDTERDENDDGDADNYGNEKYSEGANGADGGGDNDNDENNDSTKLYDWDTLYYIARYNLQMPDDEFWGCSPRRFYKLLDLWNTAHVNSWNEDSRFGGVLGVGGALSDNAGETALDDLGW